MSARPIVAPALAAILTAAACAALWFGYDNITLLRGTMAWELRYVLLGCAAFVLLSLVEWLSARLARAIGPKRDEPPAD